MLFSFLQKKLIALSSEMKATSIQGLTDDFVLKMKET